MRHHITNHWPRIGNAVKAATRPFEIVRRHDGDRPSPTEKGKRLSQNSGSGCSPLAPSRDHPRTAHNEQQPAMRRVRVERRRLSLAWSADLRDVGREYGRKRRVPGAIGATKIREMKRPPNWRPPETVAMIEQLPGDLSSFPGEAHLRALRYGGQPPSARVEGGGRGEDRTPDLCIANAALSQLSYAPSALKGIRAATGQRSCSGTKGNSITRFPPCAIERVARQRRIRAEKCTVARAHLPHYARRIRWAPVHSPGTRSCPPCSHGLNKTAQRLRRHGVRKGDACEFREIVVADIRVVAERRIEPLAHLPQRRRRRDCARERCLQRLEFVPVCHSPNNLAHYGFWISVTVW